MKLFQKILTAFLVVVAVALPQFSHQVLAQSTSQTDQCRELRAQFDRAGGSGVVGDLPIYCSVGSVYTKFLNIAMFAVGIVAVIAVIFGGYLYMTAGANDAQRKKGRDVLTWAILGLIVVILAAVIVNVVIRAVVENRLV